MTTVKSKNRTFRRCAALAVAGLMSLGANAAFGQSFPGGNGGPSQVYDPVTGYRCVDNGCTRVYFRTPEVNCICVKDNPNTQRLDRLHLTCQTKERGQWVACPVIPRFGG